MSTTQNTTETTNPFDRLGEFRSIEVDGLIPCNDIEEDELIITRIKGFRRAEEGERAIMWGVYGRTNEGLAVHLVDTTTKEEAENLADFMRKRQSESDKMLNALGMCLKYLHKMKADGTQTALPVSNVIRRVESIVKKAKG